MKATRRTMIAIVLMGNLLSSSYFVLQAQSASLPPSGQWTNVVSDPTNLVWDLSALHVGTNWSSSVENPRGGFYPLATTRYTNSYAQDGTGKVFGTGTNTVTFEYSTNGFYRTTVDPFPGTYVVRGSIVSSRGIGRALFDSAATGTGMMMDRNRRITSDQKNWVTFNNLQPTNCTVVVRDMISVSGLQGASSIRSSAGAAITNIFLGDGSWTLAMDLSPTNTLIGGRATVELNSGRTFEFQVKGGYKAATGLSKLVLTGVRTGKGSVLQVGMNTNAVTSIKGRISGQMVNVRY